MCYVFQTTQQVDDVIPLAPSWYRYTLLCVCLVGLCGNILNLVVLARRRLLVTLSSVERSSNQLLIAIAMADLCFCLFVLPAVFFTDEPYVQPAEKFYILFYKVNKI